MPKRQNPFNDSPIQLKTHVGVKEIATDSKRKELMNEVYERTKERLFSAAQRNNDVNDNHMQSMVLPTQSALQLSCQFEPKQTLLDSGGHIISPLGLPFKNPVKTSMQSGETNMQCETEIGEARMHGTSAGFGACGEFANWTERSNPFLRSHSPVNSMPASGGQLCMNLNGQLMAVQDSFMDCDSENISDFGAGHKGAAFGKGKGLHHFGFTTAKQPSQTVNKKKDTCQMCHRMPECFRCHFCERPTCVSCVRQCDSCSDHFCQLCSTLNYDLVMERAFCLNCVG